MTRMKDNGGLCDAACIQGAQHLKDTWDLLAIYISFFILPYLNIYFIKLFVVQLFLLRFRKNQKSSSSFNIMQISA